MGYPCTGCYMPRSRRLGFERFRAAKGDADVRRIVEESHVCVTLKHRLLPGHRDELEGLAHALLKAESLNEKEIREVTGLTEALSNRLCTGV